MKILEIDDYDDFVPIGEALAAHLENNSTIYDKYEQVRLYNLCKRFDCLEGLKRVSDE